MKKIFRKIILLALCFVVISPIGVQAATVDINGTDIKMEIDESRWYIFSRDNIEGNEELTYLDIDHEYMANFMQTENVYLNCIIYFGDREHYLELLVKKTPNESVNNYSNFDRKELLEFAKPIAAELGTEEYEIYENDYKYMVFSYENEGLYCYDYLTVVNGENYTFTMQKPFPYEASDLEMVKAAIDSVEFTIDQTKLEEATTEVPKIPLIGIVGIILGVVLLIIGVFGFTKWRKKSNFGQRLVELYETISLNSRSLVFNGGKKEFNFVGKMLEQIFPKGDLKELFVKYVNAYKTYTASGGNAYKTFNYVKDTFKEFNEEEAYSLLALVMLNVDGIKRYDDASVERVEPFRKRAKTIVKSVENIAANDEVFGIKKDKRLGAKDNPILVAGSNGIQEYLGAILAEDGTELEAVHKGTAYYRDAKLDVEYELSNYSLRDAATKEDICNLWFNPYGVNNCEQCIEGFAFKESVPSEYINLVKEAVNNSEYALTTPNGATVSNDAVSGIPNVTWEEVEGANKYFVYRSLSKEGIYTYQGSSVETNFVNSSAEAGYCYYYKVKAINTENEFVKSNDSNICYITCDLPQPVIDICLHFGKPKVIWEAVPGASKYEVYRKVGEEGNYSKYFTTTSTFMTNTSAEAGQTYYYKVVAVCPVSSYGNSVYSNEVCIIADPL